MKKTFFLAIPLILAACGNQTPDESDISSGLEGLTGHCEFLKFSDVKKLNGRDLGNGEYQVQQEFTLELSPLQEFAAEAKELASIKHEVSRIDEKYSSLSNELAKESNSLQEKLYKEYGDKKEALAKKYGDTYSEAFSIESGTIDSWYRQADEARRDQTNQKSEELRRAQSEEWTEQKIDKLRGERDFLIKVRSAYDKKCPGIQKQGVALVYQLLGDSEKSQLDTFANGSKKSFTENSVTYLKTERGWIRSN